GSQSLSPSQAQRIAAMKIIETPAKQPRVIRLNTADNVVVAVDNVDKGASASGAVAQARIPRGHKMATQKIAKGEPIRKFGQVIGFAKSDITPGEWVHEHNVEMHDFVRDYAYCADAKPEDILPVAQQATFQGYRRVNGKVGTRNYVGILTSVNCSASASKFMAEEINRSGILKDYPNIDGVVALAQANGCVIDYRG